MKWSNAGPRVRRASAPAAFINPAIPIEADKPPIGDAWAHEIKHDGFRLQIHAGPAGARLFTMTGMDWTMRGRGRTARYRFPAIIAAAECIKVPAIIDTEAVIQGANGITDFEAMQGQQHDHKAVAFAFDLMMLDGEDLRRRPWLERRELLQKLIGRKPPAGLHFNDHVVGSGQDIYDAACRMGLEGIVSKKLDAPYRSGRCKAWVKVKNREAPGWTRFRDTV